MGQINERYTRSERMLPDMDSTFRVFGAHLRTVEKQWTYESHRHPLFEVNLVLSGVQESVVNRQRYVQGPGDLLLLRPDDEHESRVAEGHDMTYYCLHFDVDDVSFRELLNRNPHCFHAASSELAAAIRPALDKLIELTQDAPTPSLEVRMNVLSALFELFAALSSSLSVQAIGAGHIRMTQAAARVAERIERSVEDHTSINGAYRETETITRIASEVGYSTSAINRMFNRVYGLSPRQYMTMLMLKKSKLLLMDPELTVEQVSRRLGYQSIAHFSRQFKRWTGESPSSFRGGFQETAREGNRPNAGEKRL
ncbi:AraC family transcriptional regulator [Paenibacillus massiliensis]|uniref:AraC family transcriptional regulator n=1 Tax=Paenibacillus massiliensis TaxID=225917 RepID=UPI000363B53E|nr:AraC family transcriptional regulator [Paenibacillus massiliensis]